MIIIVHGALVNVSNNNKTQSRFTETYMYDVCVRDCCDWLNLQKATMIGQMFVMHFSVVFVTIDPLKPQIMLQKSCSGRTAESGCAESTGIC